MKELTLTADGYPSEETLEYIKSYKGDFIHLFRLIKKVWAYADNGYWKEDFEPLPDYLKEQARYRVYRIATAGWSGNEDIIQALRENVVFWALNWWESRRGGGFVFKIKEPADMDTNPANAQSCGAPERQRVASPPADG